MNIEFCELTTQNSSQEDIKHIFHKLQIARVSKIIQFQKSKVLYIQDWYNNPKALQTQQRLAQNQSVQFFDPATNYMFYLVKS